MTCIFYLVFVLDVSSLRDPPFCLILEVVPEKGACLGLSGAPKLSVHRGSGTLDSVSVPEFRNTIRFALYM